MMADSGRRRLLDMLVSARTDTRVGRVSGPEKSWLGLTTNHRRLFDALQDGWLRPLERRTGTVVGIGKYLPEPAVAASKHAIMVRMKLDVEKLPEQEVRVLRDERWTASRLGAVERAVALYWPGVLPTFAITGLEVATQEERTRLTGMAREFSNVAELPASVNLSGGSEVESSVPDWPAGVLAGLDVPSHVDAIHGAMSMAVWAVPRIDPWLDLLVAALGCDGRGLAVSASAVGASWWRVPPWMATPGDSARRDPQDVLWLAALEVFGGWSGKDGVSGRDLANQVAGAAGRYGGPSDETSSWLRETQRILRGESTVRAGACEERPVGLAIQLVLMRREPTAFKTWIRDLPGLAPGVWWSAATLCGLCHGYRRLDVRFRGTAEQREFLAVQSLRAGSSPSRDLQWPSTLVGALEWAREEGAFVLFSGRRRIACKPSGVRGAWYGAKLEDGATQRRAEELAKKLGWSCWKRMLRLRSGRVGVSGPGGVNVVNGGLDVQGGVTLRLPADAVVEETFDVERFRRQVAVAAGRVTAPPRASTVSDAPVVQLDVPGLTYVANFLSDAEERKIIKEIDRIDWSRELRRRVQHYGWRYDYKARQVDPSMRLGALPEWAAVIARRLVDRGLVPQMADQLIVNEYVGDQGISAHVDSEPSFADGIAMVSLCESWEMVFREKRGSRKYRCLLERRSVAIMAGDARYRWTHEIPSRKSEPNRSEELGAPKRIRRNRRISLTLRKVIERSRDEHRRAPSWT